MKTGMKKFMKIIGFEMSTNQILTRLNLKIYIQLS